MTLDVFRRAVTNSALVVAVYRGEAGGQPIGFARVVSDLATFAYLSDVFVVEEYRGRGISKRMVDFIVNHPDLQGLRRFLLVTLDAQGLYAQFGFKPLTDRAHWMQIRGE
ncbi:GNAT family N-acetyltransferase [Cohnella rhizoplanae]|uniref:GNAT family N-acetyltransferase n=1 Tax=Cohnella rhizoplanae TaxID=2974897 RepID=UPI003D7C1EDA